MPGIRGALSIRVNDGETERHVTRHASGLKFTKVADGGHQGCTFRMVLPHGTFRDLGPQDRCYIDDKRTGRRVFGAAYIENPTPIDGPLGQAFDISAVGGMALANDETRALIYVDRDTGQFTKSSPSAPSSNVEAGPWVVNNTSPRVRVQITPGQPIGTGANVAGEYTRLQRAGMLLGAFSVYLQSGRTDADYRNTAYFNASAIDIGNPATISTTGAAETRWVGTDFASSTDYLSLALRRTGAATNVATDDVWTDFVDVCVIGQRMDRHGTLLTGSGGLGSATSVLASQVVEDLLGRLLTMCDPATAEVDVTSWAIDQLAYADGVKSAGVLNDLEAWEADYYWGIGASGPNGLHDFWYRAWPTEPRYEVSVKDGWRQTGSDTDLCNRILVSWTDTAGKTQTTEVTAAGLGLVGIGLPVDALGTRIKDADPITLPDGLGSEANALRIGEAILRDKINPPRAGTVVVRRPIMNLETGNQEMPWELEPGAPVRVRETGDELRCTAMTYDDDTVSTTLTLGRPVLTPEQRLARLAAT